MVMAVETDLNRKPVGRGKCYREQVGCMPYIVPQEAAGMQAAGYLYKEWVNL